MKRFLKIFSLMLMVLILVGLASLAGFYYLAVQDLPKIKTITDYNPPLTTTVYTKNDKVLGHLARENRFLCPLKDMSEDVPKAFLAAEDSGFYQHGGIDLWGIFRAAIKNLIAGDIVQGGSTITQQVIKSLLLTPEKSYERKLKEAVLAYRLEKYLNKDEILTIYLNQIYLGSGAYGVEAAAREYFAKQASELNLAEAALLAGLPQAPSLYNPYRNPEQAKERQRYVLKQLRQLKWITENEYQKALEVELKLETMEDPSWRIGAYYLEEVRRWLIDRYGQKTTYTGGLQVYTSASLKHLKAAEEAVQKGLVASTKRRGWRGPINHLSEEEFSSFLSNQDKASSKLKEGHWAKVLVTEVQSEGAKVAFGNQTAWLDVKTMDWCRKLNPKKAPEEVPDIKNAKQVLNTGDVVWASLKEVKKEDRQKYLWLNLEQKPRVEGALVSLDPKNGQVRALVGGYSFKRSQFNRATQAKRQTGSLFKPIVYSAALDHGFTAASRILDAPIVYTDYRTKSTWKPENYERRTYGPTLFRTGLVMSRNLVTIRVAREIGIDVLIKRAKTLGLEAEFPRNLSVSLGSASISLYNICQAFSAFANKGKMVQPRMILKVTDSWGEELYTSKTKTEQAISPQNAYIITYLMQQVVRQGTGWRVRALNRPVAGKTGTTDEQKDAWFLGFSPSLLTGVYVGFDQPQPMGKYETGSRAASPIFLKYRQKVKEDYPVQDFKRPQGIVMARIDAQNGLLAGPGTKKSYLLPFKAGTQPQRISPAGQDQKASSNGERQDQNLGEEALKDLF